MSGALPTFIVVGAPRSGTTTLSSTLEGHPQVFIAPQKEVRYFDVHHQRGVDWYRAQFAGSDAQPAIGEATPLYMYGDATMERMAALLPDIKLVAILREPVSRAYSAYWFRRGLSGRSQPFEDAIAEELAPGFVPKGPFPGLLEASRYLPALERVCRYYPRASLHVLLLEDLRNEPEQTFGALCGFLGIDPTVKPAALGSSVNSTYRLRSRRLHRAMLKYGAWRRLPFGLGTTIHRWNQIPFTYPKMDPEMRQRLKVMFADHNADLGRWLGRDLSIWDARA